VLVAADFGVAEIDCQPVGDFSHARQVTKRTSQVVERRRLGGRRNGAGRAIQGEALAILANRLRILTGGHLKNRPQFCVGEQGGKPYVLGSLGHGDHPKANG
jgi:hypothetical protein